MSKAFLIHLLTLLLLCACSRAPGNPPLGQRTLPFPEPGALSQQAHVYPLEQGWFEGQAVQYYNFGLNTPLNPQDPQRVRVEPGWMFVSQVQADGTPVKLEGQFTLFDVKPGDEGYSDLWQIHFIQPGPEYIPNSIRSWQELQDSGMAIDKSPMLVNCPFVPPGSTLEDQAYELQQGWVQGEPFAYFDLGVTSPRPGKLYAFITGFYDGSHPILVAGQHFIFDSRRGNPGYSDFWQVYWVLVDPGYPADSIRSAAEIPSEKIQASDWVVNYPQK